MILGEEPRSCGSCCCSEVLCSAPDGIRGRHCGVGQGRKSAQKAQKLSCTALVPYPEHKELKSGLGAEQQDQPQLFRLSAQFSSNYKSLGRSPK